MLTTALINLVSSAVGTFLGNFGLLWLISKKAEDAEKQRLKQLEEAHKVWVDTLKKEQERLKEYAKMES